MRPEANTICEHDELKVMALTWLRNKVTGKGLRGTTEVQLADGYVADAVALCSLQNRFFQQYTACGCPVADRFDVNYFACIFEAKASRGDFLSTFNNSNKHQNRHKPVGNLHWCVTPSGLVKADELPEFWGLLESRGSGLREIKQPKLNVIAEPAFDAIAHKLLWAIQARRHYVICANCGAYLTESLYRRCARRREDMKRSASGGEANEGESNDNG
jgi:hypothetical protein